MNVCGFVSGFFYMATAMLPVHPSLILYDASSHASVELFPSGLLPSQRHGFLFSISRRSRHYFISSIPL
jgi:hypothetical protein